MLTRLREKKNSGDLPRIYLQHPVVTANPNEPVIPLALFVDAVPYAQNDSVLGWWGLNLLTGQRYLYGILRKRVMCRCGCKGWCGYHVLLRYTTWCLQALANRMWPHTRHDGQAWRSSDSVRRTKAGASIAYRCCCLFFKGDWAELAHTMGIPSWADGLRPCFCCSGFGTDLFVAAGNQLSGLRWACNGPGSFAAACDRCEIRIHVTTTAMRNRIATNLRYDRRPAGARGRALLVDMEDLSLKADDRLEPSTEVPDVGEFDCLDPPVVATFWRRSQESLCRHRNPLWEGVGLEPESSLCIDILHCLNLGVMLVYCRVTVWSILTSGVYGPCTEQNFVAAVLAMRRSLFDFYGRRHAADPSENLIRVSDWVPAMIGTQADPKKKTKGAETWGVLLFCLDELRRWGARVADQPRLLMAGVNLESIVLTWRRHGWVLPDDVIEVMSSQRETHIPDFVFLLHFL